MGPAVPPRHRRSTSGAAESRRPRRRLAAPPPPLLVAGVYAALHVCPRHLLRVRLPKIRRRPGRQKPLPRPPPSLALRRACRRHPAGAQRSLAGTMAARAGETAPPALVGRGWSGVDAQSFVRVSTMFVASQAQLKRLLDRAAAPQAQWLLDIGAGRPTRRARRRRAGAARAGPWSRSRRRPPPGASCAGGGAIAASPSSRRPPARGRLTSSRCSTCSIASTTRPRRPRRPAPPRGGPPPSAGVGAAAALATAKRAAVRLRLERVDGAPSRTLPNEPPNASRAVTSRRRTRRRPRRARPRPDYCGACGHLGALEQVDGRPADLVGERRVRTALEHVATVRVAGRRRASPAPYFRPSQAFRPSLARGVGSRRGRTTRRSRFRRTSSSRRCATLYDGGSWPRRSRRWRKRSDSARAEHAAR